MTRKTRLNFESYNVPEHTQQALEDFIFRGFEPGSFLMSVLGNDLMGAASRSDYANRPNLSSIALWVMHNAPTNCWGDFKIVMDWVNDTNGCRSAYVDRYEKRVMWETLSTAVK
jgi:hypothetical protein